MSLNYHQKQRFYQTLHQATCHVIVNVVQHGEPVLQRAGSLVGMLFIRSDSLSKALSQPFIYFRDSSQELMSIYLCCK